MILDFEKYPSGENCPHNRIVELEDDCKVASAVLGLIYGGHVESSSRPAGCFWNKDEGIMWNKVVDDAKTSPDYFGSKGGVCEKGKFWPFRKKENICMKYYMQITAVINEILTFFSRLRSG